MPEFKNDSFEAMRSLLNKYILDKGYVMLLPDDLKHIVNLLLDQDEYRAVTCVWQVTRTAKSGVFDLAPTSEGLNSHFTMWAIDNDVDLSSYHVEGSAMPIQYVRDMVEFIQLNIHKITR